MEEIEFGNLNHNNERFYYQGMLYVNTNTIGNAVRVWDGKNIFFPSHRKVILIPPEMFILHTSL